MVIVDLKSFKRNNLKFFTFTNHAQAITKTVFILQWKRSVNFRHFLKNHIVEILAFYQHEQRWTFKSIQFFFLKDVMQDYSKTLILLLQYKQCYCEMSSIPDLFCMTNSYCIILKLDVNRKIWIWKSLHI